MRAPPSTAGCGGVHNLDAGGAYTLQLTAAAGQAAQSLTLHLNVNSAGYKGPGSALESRYTDGMRVLGVDCGSEATGYGVVESDGRCHRALTSGTIRLSRLGASFAQRLHQIHGRLTELILEHQPDCVAIEDVFYSQNVRSALKLSHVRGVAMQAAAACALPVAEYTPLAVKSAVTGYGRADKSQVQHMVCVLLQLEQSPDSLDASDALAVAICHLHTVGVAAAAAGR